MNLANSSGSQLSASEQPASASGSQNFLRRTEYLCRLAHEVHAAHHYHIGIGLGRILGQRQRVTHAVGYFLYLVTLVIMSHYHGVLLLFQPHYGFA